MLELQYSVDDLIQTAIIGMTTKKPTHSRHKSSIRSAKPLSDLISKTLKTERQLVTAVLQKWRCSASYDSEVGNQNLVLRLKFSGENRHLRKAAKRSLQA